MSKCDLSNSELKELDGLATLDGSAFRRVLYAGDIPQLRQRFENLDGNHKFVHDSFGFHPVVRAFRTADVLCNYIFADRTMLLSLFLMYNAMREDFENHYDGYLDEIRRTWGEDVSATVARLVKAQSLYKNANSKVENENFKKLLLTFAEDIRVIILMIADRLALMKAVNHHPDEQGVEQIANESKFLYAPIAHRLGLYAIKGELEDLWLKYTQRAVFTTIARKLNETKVKRQSYIDNFIAPVKEALTKAGLKFEIKGRTKSIYSIWNKIKKQRVDIDHIYDLFAIRVVIDSSIESEKQQCWLAYSIITDMFQPNPARLKDWISVPKANGYESLHTTVYGPDQRWVEVQIRTARMDEIAEKGLAAHWKYKGIKEESNLDSLMGRVRDILESTEMDEPIQALKSQKMDIYENEVFVFTPRGDLFNLPAGASLLDFAFNIHTGVGSKCTGGRVNGKVRKINYKLQNGDTVEIITAPNQSPGRDWLNFTVTSKARNKIRLALKEKESQAAELGKELLNRRCKNRKIEPSENILMKVIKKLNFKNSTEFFSALGTAGLDINVVLNEYEKQLFKEKEPLVPTVSADEFTFNKATDTETENITSKDEVLVIGNDIRGMNYKFAKCCSPIYGDDVFGFISSEGVVKIHRNDCPNADNIRKKYPYRIIKTKWSGNFSGQMAATLTIVGNDDIGVVTNITSLINKTANTTLRNISIDSHDGIFHGYVVIGIRDTEALNNLIKKIKTIKGVKDVQRTN